VNSWCWFYTDQNTVLQPGHTQNKADKMVSRNYDMGGGETSETATDSGATDIIEVVRSDVQRSSRRSPSETSGTVHHGRFQYLEDRPFELTDSLKGYNKVSEILCSLSSRTRRRYLLSAYEVGRTRHIYFTKAHNDFRWNLVL
jgi:hypothetical protein